MPPAQDRPARRWTTFGRSFVAALALGLAGTLGIAYAVDPYDSGRSTLLSVGSVRPQGPRTAAASRGRDPRYEGAILGNSHIQLIEPARLSAATGIRFVQLSVPATGPGEQFVLLDWYRRHHPSPRALVIAVDDFWCTDDPGLPNTKPFPFWLYAENSTAYLRGLLRWPVAQEVVGRIGWLLRRNRRTAARDGWWNYEPDYLNLGFGRDPRWDAEREVRPPDAPERGKAGPRYPAAERLGDVAAGLPPDTALVVVFPPVYAAALPRPGTPRATAEAACKSAIAHAARRHPRSRVIDWRRDRPDTRDPILFFDQTHYRLPLAEALGDEIAAAVRGAAPR